MKANRSQQQSSPGFLAPESRVDDRAEQVENAVRFLLDPKLDSAKLRDKTRFLRNRGLSSSEITQALKEVEQRKLDEEEENKKFKEEVRGSTGAGEEDGWNKLAWWLKNVIFPGVLTVSSGVGAGYFLKNSGGLKQTMERYREWQLERLRNERGKLKVSAFLKLS